MDELKSNVLKLILVVVQCNSPRGYFQIRRSGGGLGPHIKFGGKIWGKVRPSSQNKRKNLGSFVTTRRKNCPNFGVISKIQKAKLGLFVTYIFGGKNWGSNKNFRGKFWCQAPPPQPLYMEVPLWGNSTATGADPAPALDYSSISFVAPHFWG